MWPVLLSVNIELFSIKTPEFQQWTWKDFTFFIQLAKKLIINQKLKFLEIKQRISIAWEQQKRLLKYQLQRSIQRNFCVSSMHFKNACCNIKHHVAKIYEKAERQLKILIFTWLLPCEIKTESVVYLRNFTFYKRVSLSHLKPGCKSLKCNN